MAGHGAPQAVLLAVLGAACLVAVPFQHTVAPAERLMVSQQMMPAERLTVSQQMMRVLPGHQLYGTETYPYWERENTGDPEAFADVSRFYLLQSLCYVDFDYCDSGLRLPAGLH